MKIELKHVHRVKKRLSGGKIRYYYYVNRGGTMFWKSDAPVTADNADFLRAYKQAKADMKADPVGTFGEQITGYLQTIGHLAESTQKDYRATCDIAREKWGHVPLGYFEDPRIRKKLKAWRDSMKANPRKADKCIGIVSSILQYALDNGEIGVNRARSIANIHKPDTDKRIWTEGEINAYLSDCSMFLRWHLLLKLNTGLRQKDIIALPISADKGTHFEWRTSKRSKEVIIPILDDLRAVLDEIKAYREAKGIGAFTILFNSRGRPWTGDGLNASSRKQRAKHGIGINEHRLRGNYATVLCKAGFEDREIALILGWSVDEVSKIRRVYVDNNDLILAQIRRLKDAKL